MANQPQTFSEATNLFGRSVDFTNFVLDNWPLWVLVLAAAWLFLTLRAKHELLGELDERCEAAFADMDALLAERHALIPNLVETVKAFAGQEHKVLKDVIDARARATSATGGARLDAEASVGQSLANVWDIAESYPELASSQHFRELRAELTRTEEKITASRKFYNLSVEEMYGVKRAFPGNLIAAVTKLGSHEKFSLGERREAFAEPVKVSF
jgi:LemA protein